MRCRLAEEKQHRDHHQDGDEQHVAHVLHAAAASLEARHLGGEVAVLALDPGLLDAAALAAPVVAIRIGPGVGRLDRLQYEADPAEAAELLDPGQRQYLSRVHVLIGAREAQ